MRVRVDEGNPRQGGFEVLHQLIGRHGALAEKVKASGRKGWTVSVLPGLRLTMPGNNYKRSRNSEVWHEYRHSAESRGNFFAVVVPQTTCALPKNPTRSDPRDWHDRCFQYSCVRDKHPQANRGSVPGRSGEPSPKASPPPRSGSAPNERRPHDLPPRSGRGRDFPPLPNLSDNTSVSLSTAHSPHRRLPQGGGCLLCSPGSGRGARSIGI